VDEEGVEDFDPFLGKLQQYLDAWATASQNVFVEPCLHGDDAWRAYLQWYTTRTRTRMTYVPPNPRLDLVPTSTYPYRRDQSHNILVSSFALIQIKSHSLKFHCTNNPFDLDSMTQLARCTTWPSTWARRWTSCRWTRYGQSCRRWWA
jgi:hypothetical protein